MRLFHSTVGALLLLFVSSSLFAGTPAEAAADRLLDAIGGRARWAALQGTINDSQQNRAQEPTVVRAVIHMDFRSPRFRIDTTGPGLNLTRVIDGDADWRRTRDGNIEDVPEDVRSEDLHWYAGHVYRTLHRVASRDAMLALGLASDGRLEVHEGNRRIAWFRLDARGEPYAFGAHDDERGSLSGPWDHEVDGIRHPVWVSNPDGTWRARLIDLKTNPDLPATLFARPDVAASN